MDDRYWMGQAISEAEKAMENGEVPVGAVLVHDGEKIVASQTRVTRDSTTTAHAELLGLKRAGNTLSMEGELVLYTNLEPCEMCVGATSRTGVDRVVYALDAPPEEDAEEVAEALEEPPGLQGGLLEGESMELFRKFQEQQDSHFAEGYVRKIIER